MKLNMITSLKPSYSLNGKHLQYFQRKLFQVKGSMKKNQYYSERIKIVDVERNNGFKSTKLYNKQTVKKVFALPRLKDPNRSYSSKQCFIDKVEKNNTNNSKVSRNM